MRRVLQLIGSFHQGGSERQAVQLTRLLHESGKVKVYAAALNKEGVLLPEIEALKLPEIPEFKLTSFYDANFFKQVRLCAKFIKENEIEIVHAHDFYTNIFGIGAASLAKVPLKITSKRETGGMRSPLQKIIEKQAFKFSNAIVANAEAVKKYLISEGVAAEKIKVIYNGLDLERLKPQTTDRKTICAELNLPADEDLKFVTLVANLRHAVKNQPMFLRAARKVSEKYEKAQFVIAGEGELRGELENLTRELKVEKKVHFIGRCARVPELLSVSEICVLTSFNEGFSNSILEYMAAGKPVVATRVGGAGEAIIENKTGFLVDSDDNAALADKLILLLESEEKAARFGAGGRARAEANFSLESQLDKTLELYRV